MLDQDPAGSADDVSIHAPREERDGRIPTLPSLKEVSIHAPREERDDLLHFGFRLLASCFNPRAP